MQIFQGFFTFKRRFGGFFDWNLGSHFQKKCTWILPFQIDQKHLQYFGRTCPILS